MKSVIAVVNQKGGVGKTTTTASLAYALSQRSQRVLAVDLDPQASLTVTTGLDVQKLDRDGKTLYHALVEGVLVEDLIQKTEHFDVLPSSIRLSTGEARLVADPHTGPGLLANVLAPVHERYDFVIVDCPPTLTLLTVNALAAADGVLIPVKTDFMSLMGIPLLLDSVEQTRQRANPGLNIIGILPTMHSAHYSHNQEALDELRHLEETRGVRVFDPITRSTAFDKAPAEHRTVLEAEPGHPGATAYYQLADVILDGVQHPA